MLCSVGDLLTDVIVRMSGPLRAATDTPAEIVFARGGSAANVAVAAARAQGSARFVGRVGDDARGRELIAALEAGGVDAVVEEHGTTGTVVVLVDRTGERSFLTDRGSAPELAHIAPAVLDGVTWLHIPGYSFLVGPLASACENLVAEAGDRGVPVSISTSSLADLVEFGRDEFLELIATIRPEVVVANASESEYLLAGGEAFPHTTWTVITAGAAPTTITHRSGEQRRIPPPAREVVDTTGAGDAFTGAFLATLSSGTGPLASLHAGHLMAADTLSALGAGIAPDRKAAGER